MRGDLPVSRNAPVAISDVEVFVLKCLLEGMTHARIAAALDITEQDARTRVRRVLAKLRATSKAELIQAAKLAILN
jgi:DNA-binding CsgD family transcriptional regulator